MIKPTHIPRHPSDRAYQTREGCDSCRLELLRIDSDGALWLWLDGLQPVIMDKPDIEFLLLFLSDHKDKIS